MIIKRDDKDNILPSIHSIDDKSISEIFIREGQVQSSKIVGLGRKIKLSPKIKTYQNNTSKGIFNGFVQERTFIEEGHFKND